MFEEYDITRKFFLNGHKFLKKEKKILYHVIILVSYLVQIYVYEIPEINRTGDWHRDNLFMFYTENVPAKD